MIIPGGPLPILSTDLQRPPPRHPLAALPGRPPHLPVPAGRPAQRPQRGILKGGCCSCGCACR